jgi:peptidoglycan/xylan/chitin deacetylase (PgdA/CDA1 family)
MVRRLTKDVLGTIHADIVVYKLYLGVLSASYHIKNKFARRFMKSGTIVTYHRIAEVTTDPHLLCVTPQTFATHLEFYKQSFEVISLTELIYRKQNGKLNGHELVITFDDGYQDNLLNALPLLEAYSLPATIFVTTGFLGETANQSWDQEYAPADRAKFLSESELQRLAEHPLITIGAHTETHPRLSKLDETAAMHEIKTSLDRLKTILHCPIEYFAYPFGGTFDYTKTTKRLVKGAGFGIACTTIPKLITYSVDLLALPRINVREYSVPVLTKKLFK